MNIRSITLFIDPKQTSNQLASLAETIQVIKTALETHGYPVESLRLATTPFPEWVSLKYPEQSVARIAALELLAQSNGLNYLSVGPACLEAPGSIEMIPAILSETQMTFCTSHLIDPQGHVSMPAIRKAAEAICANSRITPDGFGNLRYAALANVQPGSPFFPAAYHSSAKPAIALAIDGASLAVETFTRADSLQQAADNLQHQIETHAEQIRKYVLKYAGGMQFLGIDFTPAPYPDQSRSIGSALEQLGLPVFGQAGSVAVSAFLMSILDRADFQRTGFNGLMLPVLEDNVLAERAAGGYLSIQKLLLYSTVCGTGLDCIPLPGSTTPAELVPVLLDLAALSARLKKQLTARLMPIPGKKAGELTSFHFDYFANSRILPVDASPLSGLLSSAGVMEIKAKGK